MPQQLLESPWLIAALILAAIGAALLIGAIVALVTLSPLKFISRTLGGLVFVAFGAAAGLVGFATMGYESLPREELAARLSLKPTGPQRFSATIRFADGRSRTFDLAGDEIAIDAHVLRWHPWASFLGLRNAYQLDRITARHREMEKERFAPRTVYALADDGWVNLSRLRQHLEWLRPVVDAHYGSVAFTPSSRAAELELRVSAKGLVMREVSAGAR